MLSPMLGAPAQNAGLDFPGSRYQGKGVCKQVTSRTWANEGEGAGC